MGSKVLAKFTGLENIGKYITHATTTVQIDDRGTTRADFNSSERSSEYATFRRLKRFPNPIQAT